MTVPSIATVPRIGRQGRVSATTAAPAWAYSTEVTADSPVAWWHLADTGSTAVDVINGLNATYVASPPLSATLVVGGDQCHDLDGSTQYATLPNSATLHPAELTIEAWVNVDTYATAQRVYTSSNNIAWLGFDASAHITATIYNGANRVVTSSTTYATATTYHTALTWNNTTKVLTAYVNGVVAAQTTFSGTITWGGTDGTIGSSNNGGSQWLNGRIDEVAVYATALSAARLLAHYQAGI